MGECSMGNVTDGDYKQIEITQIDFNFSHYLSFIISRLSQNLHLTHIYSDSLHSPKPLAIPQLDNNKIFEFVFIFIAMHSQRSFDEQPGRSMNELIWEREFDIKRMLIKILCNHKLGPDVLEHMHTAQCSY